jgi:plasmid stabilization system protein ParE
MSLRVVVQPEVETDIIAAKTWYQERSGRAADQFLRAVKNSLLLIEQNPFQYQIIFGSYRRTTLRPFPYVLVYTTTETEIVVVACMHGRRHPRRWQDRVRE